MVKVGIEMSVGESLSSGVAEYVELWLMVVQWDTASQVMPVPY